jgi:hypothetical protein
VSSDGVAEDPDKFLTDWDDDVMDTNMSAVIDTQDAVILGRRSYDEWARFWPESTIEPYAMFINAVAKFVVTSTPLDREWANARVVEGGLSSSSMSCRTNPAATSGSTPASRSLRRCWPQASSMNSAGDRSDDCRLGTSAPDGLPAQRLESIRSATSPTGKLLVDYRIIR